jgi:hypothetical protein
MRACYVGVPGGRRAAQTLKQIGSALKLVPAPDTVIIPMAAQLRDEQGRSGPTGVIEGSATVLLGEPDTLTAALTQLRQAQLAAAQA